MSRDPHDALNNPAHLDENPPPADEADLSCDEYMVFAMHTSHPRPITQSPGSLHTLGTLAAPSPEHSVHGSSP